MKETFEIRNQYIELNKLLKVQGWAETGGHAKMLIQDGQILRNNAIETRVRAKLIPGDEIEYDGEVIQLVSANSSSDSSIA